MHLIGGQGPGPLLARMVPVYQSEDHAHFLWVDTDGYPGQWLGEQFIHWADYFSLGQAPSNSFDKYQLLFYM